MNATGYNRRDKALALHPETQPLSLAPGFSRVYEPATVENCLNSFPLGSTGFTRLKPGANERPKTRNLDRHRS